MTLNKDDARLDLAINRVIWRPTSTTQKVKNVLCSVDSEGVIKHWHLTSGKCLHSFPADELKAVCMEFSPDGSDFAVAHSDHAIRIFDESTKKEKCVLEKHSNMIMALKWPVEHPNLFLSGGWDGKIFIWDVTGRNGECMRALDPIRCI